MREPDHIGRHRIRVVACALALSGLAAATFGAAGALAANGAPSRILFPVVGTTAFEDDFGDPRGTGTHQGNDILADRRAPVVAVEPGKVRFWTRSASAGCMLYLYGKSGATYLYIHLNNDVGNRNDNKGSCKPGGSYAPGLADGQSVRAGQLIGYVGDSGDADGGPTHLHFEIHPGDGDAVSPFPWLKRATRLLFPVLVSNADRGTTTTPTLTLSGTVVKLTAPPAGGEPPAEPPGSSDGGGSDGVPPPPPAPAAALVAKLGGGVAPGSLLTIRVTLVVVSTGGRYKVARNVTLTLPASAVLQRTGGAAGSAADLVKGTRLSVTTEPVDLTLAYQTAKPGVLSAASLTVAA